MSPPPVRLAWAVRAGRSFHRSAHPSRGNGRGGERPCLPRRPPVTGVLAGCRSVGRSASRLGTEAANLVRERADVDRLVDAAGEAGCLEPVAVLPERRRTHRDHRILAVSSPSWSCRTTSTPCMSGSRRIQQVRHRACARPPARPPPVRSSPPARRTRLPRGRPGRACGSARCRRRRAPWSRAYPLAVPIRVVVARIDDLLVREGLRGLLESQPDLEVAAVCGDLDSLLAAVEAERPDVVVTDIRMPPGNSDEDAPGRRAAA